MTQEHIMKKRMIRAIIFSIVTFVALLVFIGLYIDETRRVQETYRTQFIANLNHAADSIDSYLNADGDKDLKYRRIISDMSCADNFAFLLDNLTEEQKINMNELTSCLLKYPQQMRQEKRLKALKETVINLQSNLDKGFENANAIVAEIDRKGF